MIAPALGDAFRVLKPAGQLQQPVGPPAHPLRLGSQHQARGARAGHERSRGDRGARRDLARPTVGVVTIVPPTRREFFGSLDGVQPRRRASWCAAIPPEGLVVLNADDPPRARHAPGRRGRGSSPSASGPDSDVSAVGAERGGAEGLRFTLAAGAEHVAGAPALRRPPQRLNAPAAAGVAHALGAAAARIAARPRGGHPGEGPLRLDRRRAACGSSTTPTTPTRPRCGPRSPLAGGRRRGRGAGSCWATCWSWGATPRRPTGRPGPGSPPSGAAE